MELIRTFAKIGKEDAAIAGGKGASLGEMTQAGIPVPPGYVILSAAFERFIEETNLNVEIDAQLSTVQTENMQSVEDASGKIQELILAAKMPEDIAKEIEENFATLGAEFVAVRSSATAEDSASAAWAGQLDTYLNTTESSLLENVQRCWASLFTPRAIFYRFEKGLDATKISVAVVVQKMVNSDAAGIAFSVHPVTEDYNQLIIEAGFGLGEAVVSGQITPDSYVVTKVPRAILDKSITVQERGLYRKEGGPSTSLRTGGNEWRDLPKEKGGEPVLSDEQILTLADTIRGIEKHYGFPVDTEWAMENSVIYITQSRPITTLTTPVAKEPPSGTPENFKIAPSVEVADGATTLSKIFSRERSLFYFMLWNDSDQEGVKRFLDLKLASGLFIRYPHGRNSEVWYPSSEVKRVSAIALERLNNDADLRSRAIAFLEEHWKKLRPYLDETKSIENAADLVAYYRQLVDFWNVMNTVMFEIAGNPAASPEFSKEILRIRSVTEKYTEKMDALFLKRFEALFPSHMHLSGFIAPQEVEKLEANPDDAAFRALLEDRAKNGCFIYDGSVHPMQELEATLVKYGLAFEKHDTEGVNEVRGIAVQKGKVTGKVCVLLGRTDMEKVNDGDIIISPMTTPDFLPAMKMAAAFVTDEGSLTCHAAIVAREMKKPCVVGTKIATSVFHDGDMVEVDADSGIVRKL